ALEIAQDHITLAPHPFGIVGCAPCQGCMEELPIGEADVDDDRKLASLGERTELRADLPGHLFGKFREAQALLLQRQSVEIVTDRHSRLRFPSLSLGSFLFSRHVTLGNSGRRTVSLLYVNGRNRQLDAALPERLVDREIELALH